MEKLLRKLCLALALLHLLLAHQSASGEPITRTGGFFGYPPNQPEPHGGFRPQMTNHTYGMQLPGRIRITLTRHLSDTSQADRLQAPDLSYFGAVGLGSPAKMFNVVFDTGSNEIWFPYYNWFPLANNLHYSSGYSCKDSSTCVNLNRKFTCDYRFTRMSGSIYEDVLSLFEDMQKDDAAPIMPVGQLSFGQNFLAVDDSGDEQFRWKPYDAMIGMAPVTQSSSGIRNLLLSLHHDRERQRAQSMTTNPDLMPANPNGDPNYNYYNQQQQQQQQQMMMANNYQDFGPLQRQLGQTDLVFAFWINPAQHSRYGGELMIGGIDENRFASEIFFHRITSWFDWQLSLSYVMLGGQVISCPNGCNAVLDTGANSLVGPRRDIDQLYQEIQAEYNREADLWLVDCNRIQTYPYLTFKINETPYVIYPQHYVKMFRYRDLLYCHLAIKPWDKSDWLLGTTFIGAYYTIFDFSSRRIGFATPR